MHSKQMQLFKSGITRRLKLGILAAALIAVAAIGLVFAVGTTGRTLLNSGALNPPGTATGSPLMVLRDTSVFNYSLGQLNNESQLVEITEIPWGSLQSPSSTTTVVEDSFYMLGAASHNLDVTALDLYNNQSDSIQPAWTSVGLPTGYSLTCWICVSTPPIITHPDGSVTGGDWSGGVQWMPNDFNAWTLPGKDLAASHFYRMVFQLSASNKAIPGPLAFTIQFEYQ